MRLKATKMNNYAEQLIKETEPEQEEWNAENFQKWLYPESHSGSSEKTLFHFKNPLNELPEVSFKFNYVQDKTKDPLEELGIEVLE